MQGHILNILDCNDAVLPIVQYEDIQLLLRILDMMFRGKGALMPTRIDEHPDKINVII